MSFVDRFLEKNRGLHLLDACYKCEEELLQWEKDWEEDLKSEHMWPVKNCIEKENKELQALKKKILDCKMFWDYTRVHPEADEHLYLNCIGEEPESLPFVNQGNLMIKGEYIYKDVFVSYSVPAGPFTAINTDKEVFRTKISDLPEIDQEFVKTHGCHVMKGDFGKIKVPEWEKVSEEHVGHEYPDQDQYGY